MKLLDGHCPHCPGQIETIRHLFFDCIHVQYYWNLLALSLDCQPQTNILIRAQNLIKIIDSCSGKKLVATTIIFVISLALYHLWTTRNHFTFKAIPIHTTLSLIILQAIDSLHVKHRTMKGKKHHHITKALTKLIPKPGPNP